MPRESFELPLGWTGARPADAWYRWLAALGTAGDATARRTVGSGEVSRANEDLPLSEHLRLRQFLTHDQVDTWLKCAVMEPRLVEKLELVRGRAVPSRHQYGGAAGIWVGGGRTDHLNGDGRRDMRDVSVMLRAVERAHPDLVGGAGTYHATAAHGPFIHIDARGRRARWGGVG